MNKNVVIGLGGLVGVGAAVALFFGTQPSGPTELANVDVADVHVETVRGDVNEPKRTTIDPGALKKDVDAEANPNPLAAAAMADVNVDYTSFTATAGPTWQHLGLELHNSDEGLSTECRAMSMRLRKDNRNPDVDVAAVLEEQRELLGRVKDSGAPDSTAEIIEKLEGLMSELEESS